MATWHDPAAVMWGFHVHQDLTAATEDRLPAALALQRDSNTWLDRNGAVVDVLAAFRPGYGPHKSYAWELRVERLAGRHGGDANAVFPAYGKALLWLGINHGPDESGYVHPTMHNESLPGLEQLAQEASHHKFHTIVLGAKPIDLNLNFFLNPALNGDGSIKNTRDVNEIARSDIDATAAEARTTPARLEPAEHVAKIVVDILPVPAGRITGEGGDVGALAEAAAQYLNSTLPWARGDAAFAVEPVDATFRVTIERSTFDETAAAFGHLCAWLLVNRAPSPPEQPPFDGAVIAEVRGQIFLKDVTLEAALGAGALNFKFGGM